MIFVLHTKQICSMKIANATGRRGNGCQVTLIKELE